MKTKPRQFFNDEGKPSGSKRSAQARIAKVYEQFKQHEAELSRAMNRWQKSRQLLHRLEKKLAAEFVERADQPEAFPEDHA